MLPGGGRVDMSRSYRHSPWFWGYTWLPRCVEVGRYATPTQHAAVMAMRSRLPRLMFRFPCIQWCI